MTKIPLITDFHYGVKGDSPLFREELANFLKNTFFPYVDQSNLKEVIFLGDLMDRRKYLNYETLRCIRETFLEPLEDRGITLHIFTGNHDTYFKNTDNVNCIRELLSRYPNVKHYEVPQDTMVGGISIAMVPWITQSNEELFKKFLKETKSSICMGHFEIQGFEVVRGVPSEEGIDKSVLNVFDKVYSGHFHLKSDNGHIYYLGTQYDMTFSDIDEKKGFHVLDTDTRQIEFIENPEKLFFRLVYNETTPVPDFSSYKDKYVKLLVKSKKNSKQYEKYVTALYEVNPAEVSIIEEFETAEIAVDKIDVSEDTLAIIFKYIDDDKDITNPNKLKTIMNELYTQSFEVES